MQESNKLSNAAESTAVSWVLFLLFQIFLLVSAISFPGFSLFLPKVFALVLLYTVFVWLILTKQKKIFAGREPGSEKTGLSSLRETAINDLGNFFFFFFSCLIGKFLEPELFFFFAIAEILLLNNLYLSYLSAGKDLLAPFLEKVLPKLAGRAAAVVLFVLYQLYLYLFPQTPISYQVSFSAWQTLLLHSAFLALVMLPIHWNGDFWRALQSKENQEAQSGFQLFCKKNIFVLLFLILFFMIAILLKYFTRLEFYSSLVFSAAESILICNIILSFLQPAPKERKEEFHQKI